MNNIILEVKRNLGEMLKYKFNLFFANTSMIIIFYGLTEYLFVVDKEIVFFMLFCWYFATHGLSIPLFTLEDEIYDRTMVTIIQSKTSIIRVLFHRCIVQVITDTIKSIPVFTILYLIGDYNFTNLNIISYIQIFIAILLTVIITYGMGFLFSGLTLVFKRAGSFVGILDYFILFFAGITIEVNQGIIFNIINNILPFLNLRRIVSNVFNNSITMMNYLPLIISVFVWIFLGVFFLNKALNYSIKKGLIYGV